MGKLLTVNDVNRCIGCYSCMLACARTVWQDYSPRRSAVQVRTRGGLQGKFAVNICRGCLQPLCVEACSQGALKTRNGGGAELAREKCSGCGQCAKSCPVQALVMSRGYPLVCSHCGVCASFCPHKVLELSESAEEVVGSLC